MDSQPKPKPQPSLAASSMSSTMSQISATTSQMNTGMGQMNTNYQNMYSQGLNHGYGQQSQHNWNANHQQKYDF